MKSFKDLNITPTVADHMIGQSIEMDSIINREIKVHKFAIKPSKFPEKGNGKCLHMQIEIKDEMRVVFTGSGCLQRTIEQISDDDFPFTTTIIKENKAFHFT